MNTIESTFTRSTRKEYLTRRNKVAAHFQENTPLTVEVEKLSDGSEIEIRFGSIDVTERSTELESGNEDESKPLRVTVFLPGLFHWEENKPFTKDQRYNDAWESMMDPTLTAGTVDRLMLLKPSGHNDRSYLDEQNNAVGQTKVAEAAANYLLEKLQDIQGNIELTFVGYSEGATQGASIIAQLLARNLSHIKIKELVSISGTGITGPEQKKVGKIPFHVVRNAFRKPAQFLERVKQLRKNKTYVSRDNHGSAGKDTVVASEVFTNNQGKDGLIASLEPITYDTKGARQVLLTWFKRYTIARLKSMAETMRVQLNNLKSTLPHERIKTAFSKNPDWQVVAENNIPLRLFVAGNDPFSPYEDVMKEVNNLRERGGRVDTISSDVQHEFADVVPQAVGWIMATLNEQSLE